MGIYSIPQNHCETPETSPTPVSMTSSTSVILKGELHSSHADLREEKELLDDSVDVLVLEQSESPSDFRFLSAWFFLSISLLAWMLESLFQSKEVLIELANAHDVPVVYTRSDNSAPLENASMTMKAMAASLFYLLVPGSLWIGFVTRDNLTGSLLLFLGLVLPVLVVRIYNTNRSSREQNRDELIAETIATAGSPNATVLAVVGAGHLQGVRRRLPDHFEIDVHPPAYDVWSIQHFKDIGLPTLKAGFVLFSLYIICVWFVIRVVTLLSSYL